MSTNSSSTQQNLLQNDSLTSLGEDEATVPRNPKQRHNDDVSDDANNSIVSSPTKDLSQKDKDTREDDEGIKTPTSSDHKIPAAQQCPPAPRKPRAPPTLLKRKATSSPLSSGDPHCRIKLRYCDNSSTEVDSKFCPLSAQHDDDYNVEEQERKRPRRVTDD